jgi:hypothetical protein
MWSSGPILKSDATTGVNAKSKTFNGAGFLLLIVVLVFVALNIDFDSVVNERQQPQTAERRKDT